MQCNKGNACYTFSTGVPHFVQNLASAKMGEPHFAQNLGGGVAC